MFRKEIFDGFIIRNATPDDAIQMEYIQKQCYPSLHQSALMNRNHFINHIKIFPEGQIVLEIDGNIVGSASSMRSNFPNHDPTYLEITDNLWITNTHNPEGDWIYGIDIGVLPEYRGMGFSRELYLARQEIGKKLRLKGQLIAGMTIGYGRVKNRMSIEEYCYALEIKKFTDPTVTPQMKAGFRWIKPLYNYINDPESGYASIFLYFPVDIDFRLLIKQK